MTDLEQAYTERHQKYLVELASRVRQNLKDYLATCPRVDRITTRAKSLKSFLEKAQRLNNGEKIYNDPINQIQDQIGARIVTYYKSDIERVSSIVKTYYRFIEEKEIIPDRDEEFGYFGMHFMLLCPSEIFDSEITPDVSPKFFELQIKTLYQHAWSEANHDLGYKPISALFPEEKRKISFTAAQSWGADLIFDELFKERSD